MSYYARRRAIKRKRVNGGGTRKRARTTGRFIPRLPRGIMFTKPSEFKFLDSDKDDAVVSATGAITTSLNLIAQDVTESDRIGRKVTITKIHCTFSVFLVNEVDKADISGGDIIRVILYVDKQANGADASVTDILESAVFFSYRNLANSTRFQILYDNFFTINRRVAMTDGTNTSSTPRVELAPVKINRDCNIPIEYDSTAGAITEIKTNNVGLLYISKQGSAGIDTTCRIRYTG